MPSWGFKDIFLFQDFKYLRHHCPDTIFILGRIDISIGQPGKGRTTMRIVKIFYTEVFYDIFLYLSLRHKLKN